MNHPEPVNLQITSQDLLFLRAALVRHKGQLGVDRSFAYTAHSQASNSTAAGGCLILLTGLFGVGYLLWNQEWGFALAAVVMLGVLANAWRGRSVKKLRADALLSGNLFASLWEAGAIDIRFPDGSHFHKSPSVVRDLRTRFPEIDAEFPSS
jgi:hypothetical protein